MIQKKIEQNPKNPRYHTILGRLYQRSGQQEKAHRSYQTALRLSPKNIHAELGLVHILLRRKQLQQAKKKLKRLSKKHPKHAPLLAAYSEYYRLKAMKQIHKKQQLKWLNLSLQQLRKALKYQPKTHLYHYRLALLLLGIQKYTEAHFHFVAATVILPIQPCYRLGLALSESFLLKQPKKSYLKLRKSQTACFHPLLNRMTDQVTKVLSIEIAQLLQKQGKTKQAISFLKKSLRTSPKTIPGHLYLVLLLFQNNQCLKAKQILTKQRSFHPQDSTIKKMLLDTNFQKCKKEHKGKEKTSIKIIQINPTKSPIDKNSKAQTGTK